MNKKEIRVIELLDKDFSNSLTIYEYKTYISLSIEDWGNMSRSFMSLPKKSIKKLIRILNEIIKKMEEK